MSKVITYNNVFAPLDRTILTHGNYKNIDEILKELKYDDEIYELVISKNSVIQDGFFEVQDGDIVNIAIVPKGGGGGGKKILGAVAMVALAVVGAGVGAAYGSSVGSALFGGMGLAVETTTALGTALIAGGIALAGGLLLNAVMPRANNTLDFNKMDFKNSQTYGWQKATNQAMQSQAIPKVFGTHKITPPLIASYIEAIDDKQYFNALYALNDGEIKGVSDIKINNEPIEHYKSVSYEVSYGKASQELIKHFNDTHYDKPVNKKLPADLSYVVSQTDGNAVTALSVTLAMPRGLWYANDSGGMSQYSIDVTIEYSNDNQNWRALGGRWIKNTLPFDFKKYVYYDGESGHYEFYKDGVSEWDYDEGALLKKVYARYGIDPETPVYEPSNIISAADTAAIRKTFKVDNLTPDKYYVRAKFNQAPATSSRYGSDCYLEYVTETISDDFIYPKTALLAIRALATDQLNGNAPTITAVVSANSDNPAEVCRQILKDSGVDNSRIMPGFDEWASWCDEKGYKCNIVFDSELSVRKALDTVSLLGRASVIQAGSKFDVIMEKAELVPIQSFMFGMGNILSGTFKQTFLPLVDRANFIEITYYDKNKEYEPSVISVSNSPLENNRVLNKTSVTLVGCTDEAQARSYGRFMLNCNRYLTQTVEFEAHIDSLVCRYGDIVKVSHDIPQYGFSGRLLEDSEDNIITLDRDIEIKDFTSYAIQIKNDTNEIREYLIYEFLSPNKVRADLNGAEYKKYDIYSIGEINKVSKLYRIIKISTGGEFTRHITAIEYNEDVYNDKEFISQADSSNLGLSNLRISESLKFGADKSLETYVNLSWRGNALSYTVIYEAQGVERKTVKTFNSSLEFKAAQGVTYDITIIDAYGDRIESEYKVLGKLYPPESVINLTATETTQDWILSWDYEPPIDFKEFQVFKAGALLGSTQAVSFTTPITDNDAFYEIYAVDTSGVKSKPATLRAQTAALPNVTGVNTYYKNDELYAAWQAAQYLNRAIAYEIRRGSDWANSRLITSVSEPTAPIFTSGEFLIKAKFTTIGGAVIESLEPTRVIIDEAERLDKNVVFYSKEHPDFIGEKEDTVSFDGILSLNSAGLFDNVLSVDDLARFDAPFGFMKNGFYDSGEVCALGAPASCRIVSDLEFSGVNIADNFDLIPNVDELIIFDGFKSENIDVSEFISLSMDGENYGEFKPFINGASYLAQAFKMRLELKTKDKFSSPIIKKWSYKIDVPDIYESGSASSSDGEAVSVSYKANFNAAPKVQITILNANSGDDAVLKNESKDGFEIEIINGGARVAREFNYFVKGY
ncbi:phage tail protein [Campylobacter sp. RM9328]|uniref:TipJ family phage tail tip protein n=1 Tax=Campylobacter sp. RM9328 TaxID=1705720 RepID=UPI0014759F2E|nr:phage tail protein [Campylobacter sp. RM9328]